jgi:hypothetical protein
MARTDEAPREELESHFTPLLRRLFLSHRSILAVAFVDSQGECVDYCASITAYEAKITGAVLAVFITMLGEQDPPPTGMFRSFSVHAKGKNFLGILVDREHALCVVTDTRSQLGSIVRAAKAVSKELVREARLDSFG